MITDSDWSVFIGEFCRDFPGVFLYGEHPGDGWHRYVFQDGVIHADRTLVGAREKAIVWMAAYRAEQELAEVAW